MKPALHYFSIPLCFAWLIFAGVNAFGQQSDKDPLIVTLGKIQWADDGSLVCAVRIQTPASHGVDLGQFVSEVTSSDGFKHAIVKPLSLSESYLVDAHTGTKIAALPHLPDKPFFGPMLLSTHLNAKSWITMGVAFPAPPPPPAGASYELTLQVPLNVKPISITPPPKP